MRKAPIPPFTAAQYDRLALLYVIASVRSSRWLIPAYHAALDADIRNGHDDPLNFDAESFANSIAKLVDTLNAPEEMRVAGSAPAIDPSHAPEPPFSPIALSDPPPSRARSVTLRPRRARARSRGRARGRRPGSMTELRPRKPKARKTATQNNRRALPDVLFQRPSSQPLPALCCRGPRSRKIDADRSTGRSPRFAPKRRRAVSSRQSERAP